VTDYNLIASTTHHIPVLYVVYSFNRPYIGNRNAIFSVVVLRARWLRKKYSPISVHGHSGSNPSNVPDRHTYVSYWHSIQTLAVSHTVCEIFDLKIGLFRRSNEPSVWENWTVLNCHNDRKRSPTVHAQTADRSWILFPHWSTIQLRSTEEKVAYKACASPCGCVSKTCCRDSRQQRVHSHLNQATSTWDSNIIIYCDVVVWSIFMKFAGVVGNDNPHNII
jgi:hypothetical protein